MDSYSFFITSFIIILLPGTGVIYTICAGITKGKRAGIIAALGCTCGIIPHLIISLCLSSLILKMNDQSFFILKMLGSIYLLYLGAGMLLSKIKLDLNKKVDENSVISIISKGIFINLLNPKLTLFFFSFLPQYIKNQDYFRSSLILGSEFMIITFIVFCGYGILAGAAKKLIINSPRRIQCIQQFFGIIFILFSIKLGTASL